jgi:hypothetical protein
MMIDRKAIHLDLNPMSVFTVEGLITSVKIGELESSFNKIKETYLAHEPQTEEQIESALKKYSYPKNMALSKGSDVGSIEQLFSKKQLAQLAYLKHLIIQEKNKNIKKCLLLSFSSTITKINLTYHNSEQRNENAGDCAVFRYYRYRLAPDRVDLNLFNSFETKIKKLINAKKEIELKINFQTIQNIQVVKGTATQLHFIKSFSYL